MKLSEELTARGFVGQFSAETLAEIIDGEPRIIYHGIDPTADSAHVGNYVVWMLLRHLRQHGHTILFLVGGGTGLIGDPKPDKERSLSSEAEVQERVTRIQAQARLILGDESIEFVNNKDWLGEISLLNFLRDIGKHFTVNELIKKDAIATRLASETGLSYTEFAYPLLQAYDYLTLYRNKGVSVQVGGSDQWGNIIAGVDLVRRVEQVAVHALTAPLVIDAITGKKFGKSEGNAVWLAPEKTSPYSFYQFWLNVADENVVAYLKLFTLLPLEKITELEKDLVANPGARTAQKQLAKEVTAMVHGTHLANTVAQVSACLFGEVPVSALTSDEIALIGENAKTLHLTDGQPLLDVLIETGLASSKREARTFLEAGAITIDGTKISSPETVLSQKDYGGQFLLGRGKRQVVLIQITQ